MSKFQLFACTGVLLVATLASVPDELSGKPRLIKVHGDGSTDEVTQVKKGKGSGGKKTQEADLTNPDDGQVSGTDGTTGSGGTIQGDTSDTGDGGYFSTLNPTLTDPQIGWNYRQWRVNAASTDYADLDHSLMRSKNWNRLRFEVRKSDPPMSSNTAKRRSELSGSVYGDKTRLPMGESLWGAFSTKHQTWTDPVGMQSTYGIVFGQIHMGSKVGGSPALAFRRKHDGLFRITSRGEFDDGGSVRYETSLSYDQAHDFVYNVTLHPTKGRLRVWHNTRLIIDVSDISIGHSAGDSYWNVGLYAPKGVTDPVSVEVANHVYPSPSSLADRTTYLPAWPTD